ncbi:hypothetical protein [Nocardioides sp. SYSU D00038]|uniref:hypothetical protein n=1 Tax=Nocardioides sp. SYSU D00038 TaxID=2812554 RepID=UPI0019677CE0|nr:hypothetical protein [Nocardioides sp. SYSU D00038]
MSETPQNPSGDQPPQGEPQQPYGAPQQPYGQPQYSQPPYGQPQANQYGQPQYAAAPDHPQATTVLVLGILGLVLCQVLAPFAWVMGNRVVREIDASGGAYAGRGSANAGRICGIVGTVLIGVTVLIFAFVLVVAIGTSTALT